jgi:UPF0176 protein
MMSTPSEELKYLVLAYYQFTAIEAAHDEVLAHKKFIADLDMTGRIYISEEGINGQSCILATEADTYMDWVRSRPHFEGIKFKLSPYHEQAFPRMTVKYREQIVALDCKVDLDNQGVHVSPEDWSKMLESDEDYLLIDVRNDYEWKLGRFEGAELPPCRTFREFADYTDRLKESGAAEGKKVMMYCTGGIRCEPYSALLKEKGFESVYQLDGGIINYGIQHGSKHWLGKLFVFDDRLSVPISEEETPVIAKCHSCGVDCEDYFNCANTECNVLFLSCRGCLEPVKGCCSKSCAEAPRVRPYQQQNPHKPFRRLHHYT